MELKKSDTDTFFKPASLANVNTSGFFVWIICLVFGTMYTDASAFLFRVVALAISFLIAIVITKIRTGHSKLLHCLLIIGNTALIFVNASGINTITSNAPGPF